MIEELLPEVPVPDLPTYARRGGLTGLARARRSHPDDLIAMVDAAGVRGRGGAGFPTARKWAGVRHGSSADDAITVVVNAAEGEPGTFKDRVLIRANPHLVLEGALIAAHCVGATRVVAATKVECLVLGKKEMQWAITHDEAIKSELEKDIRRRRMQTQMTLSKSIKHRDVVPEVN